MSQELIIKIRLREGAEHAGRVRTIEQANVFLTSETRVTLQSLEQATFCLSTPVEI